ncbi:response regulator [Holospora curviuscula]|uniref:Response regulator of RpoS n=1 Tax=Holospora curviuscula TaxID=1082868 RepID=A0A2S5R9H3_9PROT|nr:response regulator [Holospora curviuscula]PPE03943.1 response regulator of RpoS [Holospora curviuscula]
MKCLVVDDDPGLLTVMSQYLTQHLPVSWKIYTANNGLQARKVLHCHHGAHLMITDRHMPGESGINLLQFVAETWPNTRFILISSDSKNLQILNKNILYFAPSGGKRVGVKGLFLTKPFSMNGLLHALYELTTE